MALHKIGAVLTLDGTVRARSAATARSAVMREIEQLLIRDGFTRTGKTFSRRGAAPATSTKPATKPSARASTLQPSSHPNARAATLRGLIRAELLRASPASVVKRLDALYAKAGLSQREGVAIATAMFKTTPAEFGASVRRRRNVAHGLGHREGKK